MTKRYTFKHVILAIVLMAVLCIVMYFSLILRDYNISFNGGPHLVSKTFVAGPPGFNLDNSAPEKLTVRITDNGSVGYDIQISRFKNMAFAKTHRTATTVKSQGLMKGGKTYYVRVRSVNTKPNSTRRVHGIWGGIHSTKIKEVPKR